GQRVAVEERHRALGVELPRAGGDGGSHGGELVRLGRRQGATDAIGPEPRPDEAIDAVAPDDARVGVVAAPLAEPCELRREPPRAGPAERENPRPLYLDGVVATAPRRDAPPDRERVARGRDRQAVRRVERPRDRPARVVALADPLRVERHTALAPFG